MRKSVKLWNYVYTKLDAHTSNELFNFVGDMNYLPRKNGAN
jgi:hypothetical protein